MLFRIFFAWCVWAVVAACGVGYSTMMKTEPLMALGFGFVGLLVFFVAIAATWGVVRRWKQHKNDNKSHRQVIVEASPSVQEERPYFNGTYHPVWERGVPFDLFGQNPIV